MVEVKVRGLMRDPDRHGNIRYYLRQKGRSKVRLREPYGSDAFFEEIRCARLGIPYGEAPPPEPVSPAAEARSLKWLALEYLRRGCIGMAKGTINAKRLALEAICDLPVAEGKTVTYGRMPYRLLKDVNVERIRDSRRELPFAADWWVKTISTTFKWAMETKDEAGAPLALTNPASNVKKFRKPTDGYHTWTLGEIEAYRKRHPPGTQAFLAFAIILLTGFRVSDAAKFGRQNLYEREIIGPDGMPMLERRYKLTPMKTRKHQVVVDAAVSPALAAVIDSVPKTQMIFLQSNKRRAYSDKSLSNMVRDWAAQAGLPSYCSAHGLRKALSTALAEGGASDRQLMALFGWTTAAQAEVYTRAAERRQLADAGLKHVKLLG